MVEDKQDTLTETWWKETRAKLFEASKRILLLMNSSAVWIQALVAVLPLTYTLLIGLRPQGFLYVLILIVPLHIALVVWVFQYTHHIREITRLVDVGEFDNLMETNRKLQVQEEELTKIVEMHNHRTLALCSSLMLLRTLANSSISDDHRGAMSVQEALGKLLGPLIQYRSEALRYTENDLYNFAVYWYNKEKNLLEICFRDCDNRIVRHDRAWKPGEGHVGFAFVNCKTIISSDVTQDSMYQAVLGLESDKEYYASFVSSPILDPSCSDTDKEKRAIGVFVVTSSRSGHLTKEDEKFIDSYSQLLAVFFSCRGIGKEESHDSKEH